MKSKYDALKLISALEDQRFNGTLELSLEAGKIIVARTTEAIKPNIESSEIGGDFARVGA